MASTVYSHEYKLARALQHLEACRQIAKKWIDLNAKSLPFKFERQVSSGGTRYIVYWEPIEELPVVELGLLVGDFLHNLRSALDHLAYELAAAYTKPLPPKAAETCEFPVFWKRPMDARQEQSKIGCIHPDAVNLIKAIQPYHKGTKYTGDPLWILNELERIDKHRTLHVGVHEFTKSDIYGRNMGIHSFTAMSASERLKKGAKVAEFCVARIDPNQPMHVDFRPSTTITLEPGLPLSGKPLGSSLLGIYDDIRRIAVAPLERFL
jgi:hypothetical protein